MDVLRHDHIADKTKFVPSSDLVEYSHEAIPCALRSKKWAAAVTTEGDEMKIASSVITPQRVVHRRKTPHP
jgi:hypothetical protein